MLQNAKQPSNAHAFFVTTISSSCRSLSTAPPAPNPNDAHNKTPTSGRLHSLEGFVALLVFGVGAALLAVVIGGEALPTPAFVLDPLVAAVVELATAIGVNMLSKVSATSLVSIPSGTSSLRRFIE